MMQLGLLVSQGEQTRKGVPDAIPFRARVDLRAQPLGRAAQGASYMEVHIQPLALNPTSVSGSLGPAGVFDIVGALAQVAPPVLPALARDGALPIPLPGRER
jgi:hypothetical protein